MSTMLFLFPIADSMAGEISFELGETVGAMPTGEYVDQLDSIGLTKSYTVGLKYTFDNGLLFGLEQYNSSYRIESESESEKSVLMVVVKGFTLGWAVGDVVRFSAEIGVTGDAEVSIRKDEFAAFGGKTSESQDFDTQWGRVAVDWGFLENDGSGFGIMFMLRIASVTTDDLFDSGNDFDSGSWNFGGAFRYRF
ncbi:MAG: hypothetical protein GY866_19475 [Proteobacteria bacterium]|nr:hypothetical protein [Pseudomonadota bacterium]